LGDAIADDQGSQLLQFQALKAKVIAENQADLGNFLVVSLHIAVNCNV
jgi:hypothetical protein